MSEKTKNLLTLFCILLVVAVVFAPSLKNDFINFDDPEALLDNPHVRDLSFEGIFRIFANRLTWKYHPLTFLSYAVEYHFFELQPYIYHLNNLLLHLLITACVFVLTQWLTKQRSLALITALLFGIHPIHVEPVVWITSRKDLLFTFFYLLAALSYIKSLTVKKRSKIFYGLSFLLFLCSMLSKETATTFPLIVLLLTYFYRRTLAKKDIWASLPFFAVAITMSLGTWLAARSLDAFPASREYSIFHRFTYSGLATIRYMELTLFPFNLKSFYRVSHSQAFLALVTTVALVILLAVILYRFRKNPIVAFSLLFFVLTIWPVLHIFEINDTLLNERYVYLPLLGIFLLIAQFLVYLAQQCKKRSPFLLIGLNCIVAAFFLWLGILSHQRCQFWKNSETFWTYVLARQPDVPLAYHNLGIYYFNQGRPREALLHLDQAIAINPEYVSAYFNRGIIFSKYGYYAHAVDTYDRALAIDPNYINAYTNRGNMHLLLGHTDLALQDFNKALELDANDIFARSNRAMCYYVQEDYQRALQQFEQVLAMDPTQAVALNKVKELKSKFQK